jgi:hypothetical protein
MISVYMRRCKRSVRFFGYVKERSYPKGYNRKCILCYGDIRIYSRWRLPLSLCLSVIPLLLAHATRMDVNARGSPSLSVCGSLAGRERTKVSPSCPFTTRHRIPHRSHRNRRCPNNHRTCRHQCR